MKVLLYENPEEHREDSGTARSIKTPVENAVRLSGRRNALEVATNRPEVEKMLSGGGYGAVVVHHFDFDEVIELRESFPAPRYIGFSFDLNPSTTRDGELKRDFWKAYDYHIKMIRNDLPPILLEIMTEQETQA